ncbi:iron-hydroxamate transporter substrate-binding subunit [Erwinia sp. OLTSP20]|uniref:Fe(3+)-hydroxamate ABC transporter substrate-binding protein FhuD n=1 Tax=unclassified Erwinia TaxID=2622719 RepID=UPI000C19852C|nr:MULTISPECIES: Fe(3+)-hydroxamate ABC transporter substrate-binding protein FhuD [unclassified Erwinia]PIJ49803.1 iron-hydroxamate transporter substrate-binding subunit [Erwinia sp. OAMSP11]PIJ70903.1 iron-hydroxamate transporter substrate-binding subunit [Erwinia sp. OLSSP12]PIJ80268.1 iron-hydroxamate transporter substrate-binding subunit [Erwinia sp. OLCASP19]PIJ82392.1 iron-hydroxamate transporter substrate-binding subunit [Erwinia sp. OLMTSP26]PIJ85078.1 iron-hydroxamate transporter sub
MPDSFRRRFITALACSPLLYHLPLDAAATPPTVDISRIVALEWLPVELLLTLGVTPYAVAEMAGYRAWVADPVIPQGCIEVGLRTEPNMELITELQPSLILHSQGYGPAKSMLTPIAPSLAFPFNDGRGKPLLTARTSLMTLAGYIGRESQAQQHLAALDTLLSQLRHKLAGRVTRPLLLMSLLDDQHALVFGRGSLFLDVMQALELPNAWQGETNFWGSAVIGIERLADLPEVDALCFAHADDATMQRLSQTPLWQAMPFVRAGRFKRIPAVWFYGATWSAMRFCHLLNQALEAA